MDLAPVADYRNKRDRALGNGKRCFSDLVERRLYDGYAAASTISVAARSAFQFQGSNWSILVALVRPETMRWIIMRYSGMAK